ncbi:N-acetylglucosaminyltransferase complex, subunit PIG-C/GPI2, required for phosphatidylinositol biosynthesis [Ceraceosorus bombacis]|uniref:N-acetylglucosaminyltransferase complex, subunit PIG-C/GPI2, required for phosphatidylinositol biosynthesis n=1 Tax=Ceraceosorus bombacis TaxID=401625 RepID=A0A0P1B8I7_9BASI|nr:N-acetylglucosaminyltransferase complex, subunit PIG-C/GPI2, required for phosphatidylinositol biosynthesis [Ceraceosorus bombacis]
MSNIANASITQTASRNDVGSVEVDQWEKVLWKRQPFPDSYVPSSFLSGLRRQAPRHIKLRSLVVDALPITQQLATILIFVGLYAHLLLGHIGPLLLSGTALFVMLASPAQNRLMRRAPHLASHSPSNPDAEPSSMPHAQVTSPPASIKGSGARGVARVVLALLLLSLSPILRSLSESTSSDSIWALSATLFFGHFALAPYASGSAHGILDASSHSSQVAPVRYALSVNAAIAASVCTRPPPRAETCPKAVSAPRPGGCSCRSFPMRDVQVRGPASRDCKPHSTHLVLEAASPPLDDPLG